MHVRVRVKPGRKAEAATAAPPRIKPRRTAQRRYPENAVAFYYDMARESTQTKMTCHVAAARQPCCTVEGACSISQRQHCQRRFEVDRAHSSSCALSRMYSAASACTSDAFFTPSFIACTRHTHYMTHLESRTQTSFNHCKPLPTLGLLQTHPILIDATCGSTIRSPTRRPSVSLALQCNAESNKTAGSAHARWPSGLPQLRLHLDPRFALPVWLA